MSVSPLLGNPAPQYMDSSGNPMNGATLTFYDAGTLDLVNTFTDSTGGTANDNPLSLNSRGEPESSGGSAVMIYGTDGQAYDIVLKDSAGATVSTRPSVYSVATGNTGVWINPLAAIRTSATTFTVTGDQTADFTAGRKIKCTGGADRYAYIVSSAYTTLTTVTVRNTTDGSADPVYSTLHTSMDTVYLGIDPAHLNSQPSNGIEIYEQWDITGASTITQDIVIKSGGHLNISAATTLSADVLIETGGQLTASAALTATGKITNKGTITISSASTIAADIVNDGDISVGAATTFSGAISCGIGVFSGAEVPTFSGSFSAGPYQYYTGSSTPAYTGLVDRFYPQWYGAVGNGTENDTTPFVNTIAAISAKGEGFLYIPKPSSMYMMDENTALCDNLHIYMEPGVIFDANAGWASVGQMFRVWDFDNITIDGYGAKLQMTAYAGSGSQRHGLDIRGTSNMTVNGLESSSCGGDGFYIGNGVVDPFCTNITLRDVKGDANSRQGLSITSVKGLRVINPRFTNTSGNSPAAGIDIEPDANEEFLQDIVIENPYTAGNDGDGIVVVLTNVVGATDINVDIKITNHYDYQSGRSFRVNALNTSTNSVKGSIKYIDGVSVEPDTAAVSIFNYDSTGPRVDIIRPVSYRPNNASSAAPTAGSSFTVWRDSGDTGAASIGNVRFVEPTSIDDRASPQMLNNFYFLDGESDSLLNVDVIDPIELSGAQTNIIDHYGSGVIVDRRELIKIDRGDVSFSVVESNWFSMITNASQTTGTTIATLDVGFQPDSPEITFLVEAAQTFRIDPDATSTIAPYGTGAGTYLQSNTIGNRLTIKRLDSTTWLVTNIVGTWTAE